MLSLHVWIWATLCLASYIFGPASWYFKGSSNQQFPAQNACFLGDIGGQNVNFDTSAVQCPLSEVKNWPCFMAFAMQKQGSYGARRTPMMKIISILAIAGAAALSSAGASAQEPPAFREFTFKRVKPPSGAGPRITVQIEPQPDLPAAPEPEPESEVAAPPVTGAFAWYWEKVRPELEAAGPGRLETALNELVNGPGVPTPRLASMQKIADLYGREILAATIGTKVSPALVLAVIGIESSGRVDAISGKGATGLMQLMPATAERFGTTDITDPADNIKGGVAYLDWLMGEFGEDPLLVLAGYNAGEGAVWKHGGVPPYDETRAYVPKVLAAWTVARGLCQSPPMFVSDPCALRIVDRMAADE